MAVDKDKAEAYEILLNMGCRTMLGVVVTIVWLIFVVAFFIKRDWYFGVPVGVLPLSISYVFKYYFHPRGAAGGSKDKE
jgi:hypothetical protein